MSLFKENYDNQWMMVSETNASYVHLYEKNLRIHSGKSALSFGSIFFAVTLLSISIALAFIWTPIILALNSLIILSWMLIPGSRIIQQKKSKFLLQKGKGLHPKRHGPSVDWTLYQTNELYRSAVTEWFDALRQSGDANVNVQDWNKYLSESAKVAIQSSALSPNFEKLKVLKELMDT